MSMNTIHRYIILTLALCAVSLPLLAQAGGQAAQSEAPAAEAPLTRSLDPLVIRQGRELVQEMEAALRMDDRDFSALLTVVSEKPGQPQVKSVIRLFRRDRSDQSLMLVLEPEADRGQGYLMEGDNWWIYDPVSRVFSHSSLRDTISNTSTRSSDFARTSLLEDYDIAEVREGTVGRYGVWIVSLKASAKVPDWDGLRLYIRKDVPLLLAQEELSLSGRVMRVVAYPRYTRLNSGAWYPAAIKVEDMVNEGEKSQINLAEVSTAPLEDRIFTKAWLESMN